MNLFRNFVPLLVIGIFSFAKSPAVATQVPYDYSLSPAVDYFLFDDIQSSSDIEVIATVSRKMQDRVTLNSLSIFKGNLNNISEIDVRYVNPTSNPLFDNITEGEKRLFFIKNNPDKSRSFYSSYYFGLPVVNTRPNYQKSTSPVDKIRHEIIHNILHGSNLIKFQSLLISGVDSEIINICKQELLKDQDFQIRFAALSYLLRSKDAQAVNDALRLAQDADKFQVVNEKTTYLRLLNSLIRDIPLSSSIITLDHMSKMMNLRAKNYLNNDPNSLEYAVGGILRSISTGSSTNKNSNKFIPIALTLLDTAHRVDEQYEALQFLYVSKDVQGPGLFDFAKNPDVYKKQVHAWWR